MSKLLVGRYELVEKIGEGGMAVVYKSKDRLLNRYVAIKVLRPEFTKDVQFVENFKRESQAAAGLQHPNIVSVYDVGHEGNVHFIVMELVNGRPLSEIIDEEAPFDYKRALEVTKQVASALSLAHKNNIIHRDIKPHNIMMTKDGVAKLADFGIAKAVSSTTLASDTDKIIGSVHYFSPEQARGSYVDERSDIYSLGIVLYEMLTGRVPFDGDNPVQVALMHINDDLIPPSKIVPGIPPSLEKLVMKATDKFQSNRYKNADELLDDLEKIEFVTKMVGDSVFIASDGGRDRRRGESNDETQYFDDKRNNRDNDKPKRQSEDERHKSNNKKKIAAIIGVVVAIAVILGGLYALGIIGGKEEVIVPDLKNMTFDDAASKLESCGLVIKKGEDVPSDDVKAGRVASQTPPEGSKLKEGETVTVMMSSGKERGKVPSLIGEEYDRASIEKLLNEFGYGLGTVTERESDQEKGIIIEQSPGAGKDAEKDTLINIVVSSGKKEEQGTVPSLTGKTVEEAKTALANAGFSLGSVEYEESTVYSKNYVMWQQYDAGTKLDKNTKISIKISKGAPDVTVDPENPDPGNDPNPSQGTDEGGTDGNTGSAGEE